MKPRLTVVIPTRNRVDTLVHTIKTILVQPHKNIEILVSDNFSDQDVSSVVAGFNDERLRYIRTEKLIGMAEHWDFASGNAKGEWVALIGDDDGFTPDAISKFFALSDKYPDIKAITCANSWYKWPTELGGDDAKLTIIGSKGYEIRDSLSSIKQVLSGKPVFLPTIYTGGFVHSDVLNEIRRRSPDNKLMMCINPDIYSGMAICSVTPKYIYTWEPWTIAGNSKYSTGRKHKETKVEDLNKLDFIKESSIGYHPVFSKAGNAGVGSHQIYFYDAYLQSQHLRPQDMRIALEDQLALAMVHANGNKLEKVTDYCRKVAEVNNVNFSLIENIAKRKRPVYRIEKLSKKLFKLMGFTKLPQKIISGTDMNNVYDASIKIQNAMR